MKISMIVAAAKNGVIGLSNKMPWHISGDLQYFKAKTIGKPIIMGRNTFESMGKPLPGRTSIVISRNENYSAPDGVVVVSSLDDAITTAKLVALRDGVEEIMVIGGAQIYKLALPVVERVYLTEVDCAPDGDAFFPELGEGWVETAREKVVAGGKDDCGYAFVVYDRVG